jgi:hypothetical protein
VKAAPGAALVAGFALVACAKPAPAPTAPPSVLPTSSGSNVTSADAVSASGVSCASMEQAARLAGFIAAHAIWSVSDGETLVTMVGSEGSNGQRKLDRIMAERIEESVARGKEQLENNPQHVARAALAFDGYITLPDGRTDAVFVDAREYAADGALPFEIAIPYRNAKAPGGFAVYRPKLVKVPPGMTDCNSLLEAFWHGVDSHTKAAEVWNAHIDQSR